MPYDKFVVSYTTPDPSRPQPASPIQLDINFVLYQLTLGKATNTEQGKISLKDTKGEIREFTIVEVRPHLDQKGNQTNYELFVL